MTCPWNNSGTRQSSVGTCPILWHTLYPYFLGFVFGAKFSEDGHANVGCPAVEGVDLVVSMKPWDIDCPPATPSNWRDVIQAEVVAVNGECPYNYRVGERLFFPTYAKHLYACPAGLYAVDAFKGMPKLPCIDVSRLRCPDWKENIYFSLED